MEKWVKNISSIVATVVALLGIYFGYFYITAKTVEGTVKDLASVVPLKGAKVMLADNEFFTGDDGRYYFDANIKLGRYNITVQKAGYQDFVGVVRVKDNIVYDINMAKLAAPAPFQADLNYSVTIDKPAPDAYVEQDITVAGHSTGALSTEKHAWLVIHPLGSSGWWPQNSEIIPNSGDGSWSAQARVGADRDGGKRFVIGVLASNESAHKAFVNYLKDGKKRGIYPEVPLPAGINTLASITVTRK